MSHRYTVVLTPEPDGSAVNVTVPAMPGVLTWGRTPEEALASAREAIELHLEGYAERGQPAPPDRRPRALALLSAVAADRRRLPPARRRRRLPLPRHRRLLVPTVTTVEVGQLVGT